MSTSVPARTTSSRLTFAQAFNTQSTGVLGILHFLTSPRPRLVLTGIAFLTGDLSWRL